MTKPVYAIYKQQRDRSACASTRSNKCLCYSLPRQYNTYRRYFKHFKNNNMLAFIDEQAGLRLTWLHTYLVAQPGIQIFA